MNELSPILVRQLLKAYGSDFDYTQVDENFQTFLGLIETSYQNAKKERDRNKHTLKMVDEEFVGLLDRLQKEIEEKEKRYRTLRNVVLKLEGNDVNEKDISDDNLVNMIKDLVEKRISMQTNLETSLKMIQEQNAEKSDFISFISHEIRTPLNIIVGISQMLKREQYLPAQQENLNNLETISSRTIDLLTQVIDFEKLEIHTLHENQEPQNLKNFGQSLIADFAPLADRLGNQLLYQYVGDEEGCYILDDFRMRQVLSNLINNALKFTDNGKVILRIEETDDEEGDQKLTFRVIDNGPGMTEDEVQNLFRKFSESKVSANEEISGSGLGLYFVGKLLEGMDSQILVKSIKDVGSEFYFSMLSKKTSFTPSEKGNESTEKALGLKGKRILVSDDSALNQMLVTKVLEKEGVVCSVASNGLEILEIFENQELDLILLDVNMPKMDGLETAARLREKSQIPIVPLTADTNSDKIKKFAELGINDIIFKPYKIEDFLQTINSKLNQ